MAYEAVFRDKSVHYDGESLMVAVAVSRVVGACSTAGFLVLDQEAEKTRPGLGSGIVFKSLALDNPCLPTMRYSFKGSQLSN